ncbi:MAG: hypothetical protein MUC49_14100 [Raineya sp.]|jgi:hypothetical protein|nr:hypothetical protein [Raineya sp.]
MIVSATKIQNWCNENISPVAWQRVVVKSLPQLRESGFELSDLMNPVATLVLSEDAFDIIASCIEELYQTHLEMNLVAI